MFIALFLALSLLRHVGPASATSSPETDVSELRNCPKYVFLGMRGSGQVLQPGSDVGVFGPELASLLNELRKIPGLAGNLEANYPSDEAYKAMEFGFNSNYVNEVRNEAPTALNNLLFEYINRCETDTKFILAGYSQGAYAVHWVVNNLEKSKVRPELRKRILAAIALANPGNPNTGLMTYFQVLKNTQVGKDINNLLLACAVAKEIGGSNCETFFGVVAKSALNDILPSPKVIPMYQYHKPQDIVADIGSSRAFQALIKADKVTRLLTPELRVTAYSPLFVAAFSSYDGMAKTHSSYCPKTGPFSKPPVEKCSDSINGDFVKKATKYVRDQMAKQG